MPSATTSTTTLQSKPTHIPKLSYRNAHPPSRDHSTSSIDTLASTQSGNSTPLSRPTCSPRHSFRNGLSYTPRKSTSTSASLLTVSTPPSSPGLSEFNPIKAFAGDQTPSAVSLPSSATPSKAKKKGGSIFSFFTLKEPSAQAFAEFQEEARRQAAAKNRRPTAVGLPGVSSAKLPSTVPKVNSKWNGVPETAKRINKRESLQGRTHIFGLDGGPPREPTLSLKSFSSRSRSGTVLSEISDPNGQRPLTKPNSLKSSSTTSLPSMTYFFPPEIPQQYLINQESPVPSSQEHTTSTSWTTAAHRSQGNTYSTVGVSQGDNTKPSESLPPFPVDVVLKSSGPGILEPPMAFRRKPKVDAFRAEEAEPLKAPENEVSHPIFKGRSGSASVALSPPPTSYSDGSQHDSTSGPSTMSNIPVRHLGSFSPDCELGLYSRSQESIPWDYDSTAPEGADTTQGALPSIQPSGKSLFRRGIRSVFK